MALLFTLISSNYPSLEHRFMVQKVFEPLKFDCNCSASAEEILLIRCEASKVIQYGRYINQIGSVNSAFVLQYFIQQTDIAKYPQSIHQILLFL